MTNLDASTSEQLGACPNCGGAFESVRVGPYVIDRCAKCNGLWLDERELERILAIDHSALKQKRASTDPGLNKSGKKGKCPRCGGTLIKLANLRANVTTDSCTICYGVFLDAHELDAFDHPNLAGRMGQLLRKLVGRG
jgi:Zn-finger nucleic acid-binding protein